MTVFQKYASAIFSLLVLVLGAIAPVAAAGKLDATILGQLITLTVTSIVMYIVPLVPVRFSGIAKSGVEFAGAVIVLVLPFIFNGRITATELLLVLVAVVKAAAVAFGVALRSDQDVAQPVVDMTRAPDAPAAVAAGVPLAEAATATAKHLAA